MNELNEIRDMNDTNGALVVIKYNNDLEFRRQVAFNRMYHSANLKKRVTIELVIMAVCAAIAAVIWFSGTTLKYSTYIFYFFVLMAVVLLARFLRALLIRKRTKPGDPSRAQREFTFADDGFTFGPMNDSGELLKTRWGDFDRVYISDKVIYMLCMSRKHWAALDRRLLVAGEWDALIALFKAKLPRHKLYGIPFKK